MIGEPTRAIKIFYSYAHEDKKLRDKLEKHLSILRHQHHILDWHDREISAGTEWEQEISQELNAAYIILLLVSPDYLHSEYCYSIEMKRALERLNTGDARVIAILLRPVDWEDAPFSELQVLPRDRKPVTSWRKYDEAFLDIAKGIRQVIKELSASPPLDISQKTKEQWFHGRLHPRESQTI